MLILTAIWDFLKKYITFERVFWVAVIVVLAILLLLKTCGHESKKVEQLVAKEEVTSYLADSLTKVRLKNGELLAERESLLGNINDLQQAYDKLDAKYKSALATRFFNDLDKKTASLTSFNADSEIDNKVLKVDSSHVDSLHGGQKVEYLSYSDKWVTLSVSLSARKAHLDSLSVQNEFDVKQEIKPIGLFGLGGQKILTQIHSYSPYTDVTNSLSYSNETKIKKKWFGLGANVGVIYSPVCGFQPGISLGLNVNIISF